MNGILDSTHPRDEYCIQVKKVYCANRTQRVETRYHNPHPRTELAPKRPNATQKALETHSLTTHSLLLFEDNPLTHRIYHLTEELGRMSTGEANLLGEIIRQQIQQLPIPLLVQQRLVDKLRVCVTLAALGNGEVKVQG